MIPAALTMTVLTHPLQVVLMGMVLSRLVREVFIAAAGVRQASHRRSSRDRQSLATGPSELRAV
jgi:hypothetical protein